MISKKYRLTGWRIFWLSTGIAAVIAGLVLLSLFDRLGKQQDSQNLADRWSNGKGSAQISAFFSAFADADESTVQQFRFTMDLALQESSIYLPDENAGARLWLDAYSAVDEMSIQAGKNSVDAKVIGIGGDFFLFHPLKLLSGSYFSGNDINQDYCLLDEDTAWQLFGSTDIEGMMVEADGKLLMVSGVIRRPEGRLAEAAGLTGPQIYVTYSFLNNAHGEDNLPLSHYEVIMPNPVSTFAIQKVNACLPVNGDDVVVVQNTGRYKFKKCAQLLLTYGTRSMSEKAVIYPYWENIARGYEDILMLVAFAVILLFLYAVIVFIVEFFIWWKNKGWTFRTIFAKMKDKMERLSEKNYAKRKAKREAKKNNIIDRDIEILSEEEL